MTTPTTITTTTTTTTEKEEEEEEERVALLLIEEEKEEKRKLVLSIVKTYCQSDSKFHGLAEIGKGLEEKESGKQDDDGSKEEEESSGKKVELVCQIISGGKTNYSYKLYLNNNPSKAVFAKIAFDYALW